MPFCEETLDFLSLNRVMDSREWFHSHHDEYEKLIVAPTAELIEDMAGGMLKIDPSLVIIPKVGKSISRIWRDTRRGPGLPIYRDVMWINLLRGKYLGYPSFWFEYSPRALRWGCGWYQTEPATVAAARELILAGGPDWLAAREAYEKQRVFTLEDARFKRTRHPDADERDRLWLDERSFLPHTRRARREPALVRRPRREAGAGFPPHSPGLRLLPQGRGPRQHQGALSARRPANNLQGGKTMSERIEIIRGDITRSDADANRQRGEHLPPGRGRRRRGHPPRGRAAAPGGVPHPARLRDREGQDNEGLQPQGQIRPAHARPRLARRQPRRGGEARGLLPLLPRPRERIRLQNRRLPEHIHGRSTATPVDKAARVALAAISGYLAEHPEIERVRMVCFDEGTKRAYEAALAEL